MLHVLRRKSGATLRLVSDKLWPHLQPRLDSLPLSALFVAVLFEGLTAYLEKP